MIRKMIRRKIRRRLYYVEAEETVMYRIRNEQNNAYLLIKNKLFDC